jgi:arylformamidase
MREGLNMLNDEAYAVAAYVPGGETWFDTWADAADQFRRLETSVGRARLNVAYGPGEREKFDLFLPAGRAKGLVVFVHGGYWRRFGREWFSHCAGGPTARGWAVAMPSYTLAPEARIPDITRAVGAAIDAAGALVSGPVVVTGHSAGGHLSARMMCADVDLAIAERLVRVIPISPVVDLRPLLETTMNADLRLDMESAAAESPVLCAPRAVDCVIWVGGAERPAFLDQARWLHEAWPETRLTVEPERHHFDVILGLERADSSLTEALIGGL